MAVDTTKTTYGYLFTCTGGTAVPAVVLTDRLRVVGVHFTGAATSDIITINDAAGNLFLKGYGGTGLSCHNMTFSKPVSVTGLQVGVAGATTGKAVVFIE